MAGQEPVEHENTVVTGMKLSAGGWFMSRKPTYTRCLSILKLLPVIMLLVGATSGSAGAAGGDFVAPFPVGDTQAGKQEATAMAVDGNGNTVVTGYRNLAGNADDDYYTVSFKADGSGVSWSASYNRSGGSDRVTGAAIDSNRDVIVTGVAWNGTNKDIHTIKYNGTTGAVIWQATFNGGDNADDYASGIATDSLNNVYVGGYTNAAGTDDYLVLAYNSTGPLPDGGPAWKVTYNGPAGSTDKLASIATGADGIGVTGYSFNGSSFDTLSLKYGYTGEKLREWRHTAGGTNPCWGQQVRLDAAGNLVMTGFCFNGNDKDIYTARYNAATGAMVWEKQYDGGANMDDEPAGLYVDAAGDVHVTGYTGTLTRGIDFYTVKYRDPEAGAIPVTVWEKNFNSAADNTDIPVSLAGDAGGNLYVTGYSSAAGFSDFLTVKYLAGNGTQLWYKSFNGSNSKNDKPAGVGVSSLTGALAGEEVFVAGWSEQATNGDYDYYVVRHDVGAINPPSGLAVGTLNRDVNGRYSVPFTWSDNSANEEGFVVERKQGEFGDYEAVATLPADTVTYTDSDLDENTYYYYRVKAFNSVNGNSNYSNELRVLTLVVAPIAPVWHYLYNGRFDSDDVATAVAVGPDNHPIVTGYTLDYAPGYSEGTTSTDYFTVKLHKDTKAVIWSDQHDGGTNQEDDAMSVVADAAGNIIVTGNSFQFPGGESENINSLYTLKYQAAAPATILWKGQYNGPAKIDDRATTIVVSGDGTGTTGIVGHGKSTPTNDDIYALAYASSPELGGTGMAIPLWAATPFNGGGNDYASAAAFDADGNLFVTGYSETAAGSGVYRTFTAKYCGKASPSCAGKTPGQIIWSDLHAGSGDNRGKSIAVDNDGNVYVSGFGINAGTGRDFLLLKYDGKAVPTDQRLIWARTSNGAAGGDDQAVSVRVDSIDNNAIVTGDVLTTACAGEPLFCDNDIRVIRYAPDGSVVWTSTYLRPAADDHVKAMALDVSGNIFVVGTTGDGITTDTLSAKYSFEGIIIGATSLDGAAHSFDEASAVAISSLGDAFVAGYSRNVSGSDDYLVCKVAGVALQAPSPLTVTPNYTNAILAWSDNSAVEDGFHVERKIGACTSTSPWVELPVSPLAAGTTGHTDPGLTIGQEYCYRLRAFRSTGETTRWIERSALMQTPPPPGSFTAVSPNTTTVNLSWADTTTNESGFQIERCQGAACDFSTLDEGFPATVTAGVVSYSDTSVCAGTTYRYRILSFKTNSAGTGNEWQSVYTTLGSPVSTAVAPVPAGFAVASLNESQIRLTWSTLAGDHAGFNIYECTVPDCSATTLIGTAAAAGTSFIQYGLIPNSTHTYLIRAYKTAACPWEGEAAGPVSATTANVAPTLAATALDSTNVNLSWNDTTGSETGFEIQKCTSGDCTADLHFTTLLTTGVGRTAFTDSTLCKATSATYRVRARNQGLSLAGGGTWSKRARLTITNFQSNFQTRVNVGYLAGMNADFSDIRFYDASGKMELPYWIESKVDSSSAVVWLRTGPANDIYMYYGNPSAVTSSSGIGTFEFFDDFTGASINTGKWMVVNGANYYSQNNELIASGGPGAWTSGMVSVAGFARPFVFEMKQITTGGTEMMLGVKDAGAGISYTDFPYAIYLQNSINLLVYEDGNNRGNRGTRSLNAWDNFKVEVLATGAKYYAGISTAAYTTYYTGAYSSESPLKVGFTNVNRTFRVDDARVRKYAATEPTVAIGAPADWAGSFGAGWDGAYSNHATAVTPTPAPPATPVAERVSEAEIRVTWTDATSDETGFFIDRCSAADCNEGSILATLTKGANVQQLNDTALSIDTTYYYRVRAYKTAACGWDIPAASIVNATTTLLAPANPVATTAVTTTCNDLRFTDSDGTTLLNYQIDHGCNTANTRLSVKVPAIAEGIGQIYLYYSNPPATPATDGAATWDWFEDFNGSAIDTGRWSIFDGTGFTVTNGMLRGTNTTGRLISIAQLAAGQVLQAKVKAATLPTNGFTPAGAYSTSSAHIGFLNHPGMLYHVKNGVYTSNPTTPPAGSTLNDWMLYSVGIKDAATVNLQVLDLSLGTSYWAPGDMADAAAGRRIALGRRYENTYTNQAYVADWDWIRVGKYASPTPSFSLVGAEEAGEFSLAGGIWSVRRPLTITHTGGALTNYQMLTSLDTTSLASDQITVAWSDTTVTETGFVLERCTAGAKTDPDCDFSSPDPTVSVAAGVTSYVDRSVIANRKYCYRVKGEKTSEPAWTTAPSAVICTGTSDFPGKPALTVTPHETTMDLSWNDTAVGENAYILQRCKGTGCDIGTPDQTFTVSPNRTSFSDTTVCSDTYTYRIRGVKYGVNAWETPISDSVTQATVVAAPPALTSATRVSDIRIDLAWQDNTGDETGFEIERCEGAACDFSVKTVLLATGNAISYSDTGLNPNTLYRYRLRAYKTGVECGWPSGFSAIQEATTTVAAPTGVSATAPNTTRADIVWTDTTSSEGGFALYRCRNVGCTPIDISTAIPANAVSFSDTGVCADSHYTYQVQAVNTAAQPGYDFEGPLSATGSVVTPAPGNRVADADFEIGAASWPTAVGTATGTSFDTTTSYSGKTAFKLAAAGAAAVGRLQAVSVLAGEQYVLSGYLKTALTNGRAQCDVQGVGIDSAGIAISVGSSDNNAGWKYLFETVTIPVGTTSINVRCFGDGSFTGSAWFDMIQLRPVNVMKLTASRISESQVNLNWNDIIPDESGFQVERCSVPICEDADFTQVGTNLTAGSTSFTDIVAAAASYTYRIRAFKTATCGWTALSNAASVTTSLSVPVLAAAAVSTTQANLSWTYTSASETGMRVERCQGAGCTDFAPIGQLLAPGTTAYSDTAVCSGTTYRYQVTAVKEGLSGSGGSCWTRMKTLTVSNHFPAVPMRYEVAYDADMKADYSDIRFFDTGVNMELAYWIERADGSSATVWIKTGGSASIDMYYGNPEATAASNGSRVFEFFDDFTGTTLNATKWTEVDTAANYFTQNGELISSGGPTAWTTGLYSTANFTRPFVFEANVMDTGGSNMMIGAKNTGTGISYTNFTYATYYTSAGVVAPIYEDGTTRGNSTFTPLANAWKYLRLEVLPTGAVYHAGNGSGAYSSYYTSNYSSLSPLKVGFANYSKSFRIDTVRVRRYLSTEPAVSATGTEVVLAECPAFAGNWTSPSAPVAVTTPAWVIPANLQVMAEADTRLRLTWTDATNDESGFRIQRCQEASCTPADMVPPVAVAANTTSYSDTTASASAEHCYRIAAFKTATCSWQSDYTATACDITFPQQTGDLTAVPIDSRRVRLSWTDMATDEDGYEVEVMTWNGLWAPIATLTGTSASSYDHAQGLEPERRYSYRIRPFRGTDKSPYSNIATVMTPSFSSSPPSCP